MKRIYCNYGTFVYCDAVTVDNIYSIDINEQDKTIEFNGIDNFPIAWVTDYDTVEEISIIRYDEEGNLSTDDYIVKNGKMIYNGDDIYED